MAHKSYLIYYKDESRLMEEEGINKFNSILMGKFEFAESAGMFSDELSIYDINDVAVIVRNHVIFIGDKTRFSETKSKLEEGTEFKLVE